MQETWDHILHDKGKMFDERNGAGYCIDEVNVAEDIRLMRWNRDSRLRSQSTADKTQRRPPKADGSLARPDFEPAPKPVRKPTVKTDPRPDPRPRRRVDDEPSQKPETESSHKPEDEPRAQPKIRTKLKTIQTTSKAHAQDFKKWLKKWERYGQDDAVWYRPDGSRKVLAKIDRQAVKSLGPRMWLNDDVINFWTGYSFEQLKKRDPQAAARFYIGSHYIASTAQQPEHRFYLSRVKQEAQNNIFDVDYFVVPEQKTGHWTIAVACNPRSLLKNATPKAGAVADGQFRIVTLDSLYQGPTGYILAKRVHKFLVDVAKEQGQAIEEKFDDEYHVCFQEAPDQGDSYNCGVFAVWFIEIIMNDPDMILSSIIEDRDDHMSSFMDLNANAKRHEMMEVIEGLNIQKLRKAHDDRQYPTAKPVAKHGSGEREAQLLCHDGCNQPYDPELGSKLKCGHKILLDCLKRAVSDGIIKSTNNCPLCDSGDLVKVCIVCRRRIDGPALEKGPGYMLKSGHYVHNDCRLTVEDLDHSFPDERKEFEKRGKVSEPPQDGEGIVDVKESEVDRDGNMITEEELTPLEKSENEVSEPMETDADLTSHEQIEYKAPEQRPHKGLAMLGLGEQDSDGEIVQIGGAEEPMDYIPFDPSQSTVEDPEEERVKLTGTILDSLEDHDADDVSEGGRQGDGDENNDGGENNDGNTLTLRGGAEPFQDLLAMHATDADSDVEMTDLGLAHSNHSQNILSGGLAEMMDVVRTSPPRHMPIRSSPTSRKRFSPLQIEIHEDAPATHVSSPISPRAKRQRLFAGSASSPARPHTRTQFAAASPPLRTRLSPRSPAAAARPVAVTPTQIQPVKRKRERDGDKIVIPGERRSTRRKGRHVSEPIELD